MHRWWVEYHLGPIISIDSPVTVLVYFNARLIVSLFLCYTKTTPTIFFFLLISTVKWFRIFPLRCFYQCTTSSRHGSWPPGASLEKQSSPPHATVTFLARYELADSTLCRFANNYSISHANFINPYSCHSSIALLRFGLPFSLPLDPFVDLQSHS